MPGETDIKINKGFIMNNDNLNLEQSKKDVNNGIGWLGVKLFASYEMVCNSSLLEKINGQDDVWAGLYFMVLVAAAGLLTGNGVIDLARRASNYNRQKESFMSKVIAIVKRKEEIVYNVTIKVYDSKVMEEYGDTLERDWRAKRKSHEYEKYVSIPSAKYALETESLDASRSVDMVKYDNSEEGKEKDVLNLVRAVPGSVKVLKKERKHLYKREDSLGSGHLGLCSHIINRVLKTERGRK